MMTEYIPVERRDRSRSNQLNVEANAPDESVWASLRAEAARASFASNRCLHVSTGASSNRRSFEDALVHTLARRLGHPAFS